MKQVKQVKQMVKDVVSNVVSNAVDSFAGLSVLYQLISSISYLKFVESQLVRSLVVVRGKIDNLEKAMNLHQEFVANEGKIERIKDWVEMNHLQGFEFSFNEGKNALFPELKQIPAKQSVRLEVQNLNESAINYPLLWDSMTAYKCSFKELPFEIRAQFNGNTRSKYTSYFPYFNSFISNGSQGNGYIAQVIKEKGNKWVIGKKPIDFPQVSGYEKVSDSTISQFLNIVKNTNHILE
jgi:hypothetical protein